MIMMIGLGLSMVTVGFVVYSLCVVASESERQMEREIEYRKAKEKLEILETEWNYLYYDYENGVYEDNEIEYDIRRSEIEIEMDRMERIIEGYEGK
jgi:hypothetical protein